jgi:hypothetical protein
VSGCSSPADELDAFIAGLGDGLAFTVDGVAAGYLEGDGEERCFDGQRPRACPCCQHEGPAGLWANGYTPVWLLTRLNGALTWIHLWKRRFLCTVCRSSWHNRPPDEVPGIQVCTLVFVTFLWAVLAHGPEGAYAVLPDDACQYAEVGTLGRWYRRACAAAEATLAAIREVVGERSEPGPAESAFTTGLSPPTAGPRRRWSRPGQVAQLWRSFAMIQRSHNSNQVPYTRTLAQARLAADKLDLRFLA